MTKYDNNLIKKLPSIFSNFDRLADILNQISDGIYITDPDRKILFWNLAAEKITGYRQEDVLGKYCADNILAHTDMAGNKLCGEDLCPLHKTMHENQKPGSPLKVKAKHRDGGRVVVEVSFTPLYSPEKEIIGGLEIFRDVSESVELEEQKARFFSSLSHELKTPLANMQGYLELILAKDAGPLNEVQEEFLKTVYEQEQKLSAIIEDLLDMGHFESTDFSYEKNLLDLSEVLNNVARSFYAMALKKGLDFKYDLAPGLTLLGDRERLTQAFNNLLGNAIKYTEKGTIELNADYDRESGEIVVKVSDSGIGIPEDDQKAIFEMFYRVENPGTRSQGGTGVGLYVVDRIIKRHDGRIHLESTNGAGSTFTVYLPGSPDGGKES